MLVVACGESVAPDFDYPITYSPESVANLGVAHAFVNDGGIWREIDTTDVWLLTYPDFTKDLTIDSQFPITLLSGSMFEIDVNGTVIGPYNYLPSGDRYQFVIPDYNLEFYARVEPDRLTMYRLTVLQVRRTGPDSVAGSTLTVSPDPSADIISTYGNATAFDTLVYRTHEFVFRAER